MCIRDRSIDTLETTRENLGSSVALMCGLDANTIVMPADFETLYEGNLDKMSYQKDLELSLIHISTNTSAT